MPYNINILNAFGILHNANDQRWETDDENPFQISVQGPHPGRGKDAISIGFFALLGAVCDRRRHHGVLSAVLLLAHCNGRDDGLQRGQARHVGVQRAVGGENFSHTVQSADDIVYESFGLELISSQEFIYTDDGMFYIRQTNLDENGGEQFPYDQGSYGGLALASWQNFGLNVSWQLNNPDTGDPIRDNANAITNEAIKAIAAVDRWPNYGLNVTLTGDAAEASITLGDWINAAEFEFVTGARSLDEYEDFANEWLSRGGQAIIEQTAECLGCEVPEYAQ